MDLPTNIAEIEDDRVAESAAPGRVFWITGLSGAGKSTTARRLTARLRNRGRKVVLLDGDELRSVYGDGLLFSLADRRTLALRHARLCQLLSRLGLDVVIATISLFHECHAWCKQELAAYHEIYLRVPLEELRRRDPRGLYARAQAGEQGDVAGVDLTIEEPLDPDLVIDNDGRMTPEAVTSRLWQYVLEAEGRPTRAG